MSVWEIKGKYVVSDIHNPSDGMKRTENRPTGEEIARSRAANIYDEGRRGVSNELAGRGFPSKRSSDEEAKLNKIATELEYLGSIPSGLAFQSMGTYSKKQLKEKLEEEKSNLEEKVNTLTDMLASLK